jgi:hypothetical protein
MSIYEDYFKYTEELYLKYGKEKTLVLLQVGDFFEAYGLYDSASDKIVGSNIEILKNELGMKISCKKDDYKDGGISF